MTTVQRYAEIKLQIKALETELETIKEKVFTEVMDQDGQRLETSWGEFRIQMGKKKWIYSEKLTTKEQQFKTALKELKKKEETDGTAQLEAAPSQLVFTAKTLNAQ